MSKKRWALDIPLHLKPRDYTPDACDLRLHLYQYSFHVTGGKGFRVPKGTGSKRKRPRKGWGKYDGATGRAMGLQAFIQYGERHVQ